MHDLRGAVLKSDPSLTKVMLAELTWQTLEPYHWRFGFMRTDAADQIVEQYTSQELFEASEYFTGLGGILWLAGSSNHRTVCSCCCAVWSTDGICGN